MEYSKPDVNNLGSFSMRIVWASDFVALGLIQVLPTELTHC